MILKKLVNPSTVTALLIFISVLLFIQFWDIPFRDLINRMAVLSLYGLLIFSYILRIALIFIGLFALYRAIWIHINGKDSEHMEV